MYQAIQKRESQISPISMMGTNSTMFTDCCNTAICNNESNCPKCGSKVIGHDAESNHERGLIRWENATRHWNRKSFKK